MMAVELVQGAVTPTDDAFEKLTWPKKPDMLLKTTPISLMTLTPKIIHITLSFNLNKKTLKKPTNGENTNKNA